MTKRIASILVLIGGASYGVLSAMVKLAYNQGYTSAEVTGSQILFGMILLSILALWKRREWRPISVKSVLLLMFAGSFAGWTGIFYYLSLKTIPASIAIVLLFQFVWVGVLLEVIVERKKPNSFKGIALFVLMVGTLLSTNLFTGEGIHTFTVQGVIFGLLSAVSYALFIFFSGKVEIDHSPYVRSPFMMMGGVVVTFIVFPPFFLISGVLWEGLFKWALLIGIFGGLLPTLLFAKGVPVTGGGLASILGSIELPVAVILSLYILGESVASLQWLGIVLILLGIFIAERKGNG